MLIMITVASSWYYARRLSFSYGLQVSSVSRSFFLHSEQERSHYFLPPLQLTVPEEKLMIIPYKDLTPERKFLEVHELDPDSKITEAAPLSAERNRDCKALEQAADSMSNEQLEHCARLRLCESQQRRKSASIQVLTEVDESSQIEAVQAGRALRK
jgi:hypothetical protein